MRLVLAVRSVKRAVSQAHATAEMVVFTVLDCARAGLRHAPAPMPGLIERTSELHLEPAPEDSPNGHTSV